MFRRLGCNLHSLVTEYGCDSSMIHSYSIITLSHPLTVKHRNRSYTRFFLKFKTPTDGRTQLSKATSIEVNYREKFVIKKSALEKLFVFFSLNRRKRRSKSCSGCHGGGLGWRLSTTLSAVRGRHEKGRRVKGGVGDL